MVWKIRNMAANLLPESGRMIHVQTVAELVDEYVFHGFGLKKKEFGV